MTGATVGKKCVSGLRMNNSPASVVTPPAAIAKGRSVRRSEPAIDSTRPVATSNAPRMSEEMLLPAGIKAAPIPRKMIARPATAMPRARARADQPASTRVAMRDFSEAPTSGALDRFLSAGQHPFHAARGLAEALLVFDQSDADEAFAFLAESDAGRDRDMRFGQQAFGELHRTELLELLRDRRPGEHRGFGRRDVPSGAAEAFDQHVAPLAVEIAVEFDDVLRAVQSGAGGGLYRREGPIIEVGFDPRQRFDQPRIADREADPPSGHRIGLGHRGELDRDVPRAVDLEDRRR